MEKGKEIDEYYTKYMSILSKPDNNLSRDDKFPFSELIIREEFSIEDNSVKHIFKKVVLLNTLYSTNIYSTFDVALNISKIPNFSSRAKNGDINLIEDVRKNIIGEYEKDFYSFATKYCHHHNPNAFPIYDSIVEDMLIIYLSELFPEERIYRSKMRNYEYFKMQVDKLANIWELGNEYLYIKLDKYLWQKGQELVL